MMYCLSSSSLYELNLSLSEQQEVNTYDLHVKLQGTASIVFLTASAHILSQNWLPPLVNPIFYSNLDGPISAPICIYRLWAH